MTHDQNILVEKVLVPAIITFYEGTNLKNITQCVRDYFFNFCLNYGSDKNETLNYLNSMLPEKIRVTENTLRVPKNERNQKKFTLDCLYGYMLEQHMIFDSQKQSESILRFSELTGIETSFIISVISKRILEDKKQLIENAIYPTLNSPTHPISGEERTAAIAELSSDLDVPVEYMEKVLKNKERQERLKKEKLEKKSQEHECK